MSRMVSKMLSRMSYQAEKKQIRREKVKNHHEIRNWKWGRSETSWEES